MKSYSYRHVKENGEFAFLSSLIRHIKKRITKKKTDAYLLFFKTLLSSRFSVVKKYMYYETNLLLQLINIKLLSSFPFSILQVSLC